MKRGVLSARFCLDYIKTAIHLCLSVYVFYFLEQEFKFMSWLFLKIIVTVSFPLYMYMRLQQRLSDGRAVYHIVLQQVL